MSSIGAQSMDRRRIWWTVPFAAAAYLLVVGSTGRMGLAQVALVSATVFLAFWNQTTRQWFLEALPFVVFLVGYDLVRYPRALLVSADRVVGCELEALELALIPAPAGGTWPDYFLVHHMPLFDVIAGIPYFAFVYVVVLYSIYLYFRDRPRMRRFLWAFAIGNYLSFVLWLAVPAAPPWYLHAHGCAIDAGAAPSAAGLMRVDALLGTSYFQSLYAQSSAVFGAMPSMHCSFPMMGLMSAWKHIGWRTRPLHIGYVVLMAVSAVYLDHHWVLDVIGGWIVAALSVWAAGRLMNARCVASWAQCSLCTSREAIT